MTYPTIYPTGATVYDPKRCWNGYTVFQAKEQGALLIDMNGGEVQLWENFHGMPNRILPGGYLMGSTGERPPAYGVQDGVDLVQVDWEGNVVWRFDRYEYIKDPGEEPRWMARQHHDYQREGNPVGYYAPGMDPLTDRGNTVILSHKNLRNPRISDKPLLDDTILEVSWEGDILWEWIASDHFEEMGFREDAKNALFRNPNWRPSGGGMGDWMHINSLSLLGPNRWFESGDARFHPENMIWCARETNLTAIIDKRTGKIVWKLGPNYDDTPELRELGWIIGQHHAHLIPKGLPGEGNVMIFDNGGWAGYGSPNPGAPAGFRSALRDYSRVLEIDPTTLKVVWQYTPAEAGLTIPVDANRFYSPFISSAQRLPNGNTLITEGSGGRIIEVTSRHEIVWEYISPYWGKMMKINLIYRAYRVPYEWVPQVQRPEEKPIERLDVTHFRVPGASRRGTGRIVPVQGVLPYRPDAALCVLTDREDPGSK